MHKRACKDFFSKNSSDYILHAAFMNFELPLTLFLKLQMPFLIGVSTSLLILPYIDFNILHVSMANKTFLTSTC